MTCLELGDHSKNNNKAATLKMSYIAAQDVYLPPVFQAREDQHRNDNLSLFLPIFRYGKNGVRLRRVSYVLRKDNHRDTNRFSSSSWVVGPNETRML